MNGNDVTGDCKQKKDGHVFRWKQAAQTGNVEEKKVTHEKTGVFSESTKKLHANEDVCRSS